MYLYIFLKITHSSVQSKIKNPIRNLNPLNKPYFWTITKEKFETDKMGISPIFVILSFTICTLLALDWPRTKATMPNKKPQPRASDEDGQGKNKKKQNKKLPHFRMHGRDCRQRSDEGDERCYSPPSWAQLSFACLGSAVTLMTFH